MQSKQLVLKRREGRRRHVPLLFSPIAGNQSHGHTQLQGRMVTFDL